LVWMMLMNWLLTICVGESGFDKFGEGGNLCIG
jgi:hypothetical protein